MIRADAVRIDEFGVHSSVIGSEDSNGTEHLRFENACPAVDPLYAVECVCGLPFEHPPPICTMPGGRRGRLPENLHGSKGTKEKFYCLRQVHLAENLPRATHTRNRVETT